LSVQDSNNKHIKEEKDEHLDKREQVGKNEGKIHIFRSLPTQKSEKNYFFYRPTDPYFSHDLPEEQQIKFVSPKGMKE